MEGIFIGGYSRESEMVDGSCHSGERGRDTVGSARAKRIPSAGYREVLWVQESSAR